MLGLTHGFASNVEDLICNPVYFTPGEIYSQLTNWEKIEETDYVQGMDSYCYIFDEAALPFKFHAEGKELFVEGDLSAIEVKTKDHRWALLGNVGLWFRHALIAQESDGIFSLHAAAIHREEENELLVIVGKAGSGKTVFLLEAIRRGYKIFSTEMTYFRISSDGVRFLRGAMYDNIRLGNFLYDFPETAATLALELPKVENPWDYKISVNLASQSSAQCEVVNPRLSFVFPRIEKGITETRVKDISDQQEIARYLFNSASEKIGSTFLIYDAYPIGGLDRMELAANRWQAMRELVAGDQWEIKQAKSTLAGPNNCMEGII